MTKSSNPKKTFESHHQAHSPMHKESPQSIWFVLPPIEGALQDNKERVWRDLLADFYGMGLHAEILIARSNNLGRHAANPTSPSVTLAINLDGADEEALNAAILQTRMLLIRQMAMRDPNPNSHKYEKTLFTTLMGLLSRTSVDGMIRNSLEEIRDTHKAGLTPLSRAIWYRMGESGIMECAMFKLSEDLDPVHFQTVMKKEYGKKPARSRIPA